MCVDRSADVNSVNTEMSGMCIFRGIKDTPEHRKSKTWILLIMYIEI